MKLPKGVTSEQALAKYCRPNLVKGGLLRQQFAPQFWSHRGAIKFPRFGDNWPNTFRRATALGARGLEADLQQVGLEEGTAATFISVHDRTGGRILVDRKDFFKKYRPDEILGQPIVVHQLKHEQQTGKYYVTSQTVSILPRANGTR